MPPPTTEMFRAGEALLRSPQPLLLLPFLAPTAHRTISTTTPTQSPRLRRRQWHRPSSRPLTTSSVLQAPQNSNSSTHNISTSQRTNNDLSALLDGALDGTKGSPAAPATRTSRFKSPSAQATNPPSRSAAASGTSRGGRIGAGGEADQYKPPPGSAVDEIFSALQDSTPSSRRQSSMSDFADISSMLNPRDRNPRQNTGPPPIPAPKVAPMQLGPRAGRTVHVDLDRNMDVGRAFRALEMQCARNSVRRDFMRQRFHERAGLKRKRLKGERWRRRFREGFRGVVKLVQKMKKQGW